MRSNFSKLTLVIKDLEYIQRATPRGFLLFGKIYELSKKDLAAKIFQDPKRFSIVKKTIEFLEKTCFINAIHIDQIKEYSWHMLKAKKHMIDALMLITAKSTVTEALDLEKTT